MGVVQSIFSAILFFKCGCGRFFKTLHIGGLLEAVVQSGSTILSAWVIIGTWNCFLVHFPARRSVVAVNRLGSPPTARVKGENHRVGPSTVSHG
jgi:hypothetical protein